MRLTNNLRLPAAIVRACEADDYDKGDADYSVTELIAPPRVGALHRRHDAELTEDVSDRIYLLMGTLGHKVLEASDPNATPERVSMFVDGVKVSGKGDSLIVEDRHLDDFKFTSVWTVADGVKPEWEAQLNLYRLLLHEASIEVDTLGVVALLRDWSKGQARRGGKYPQQGVVSLSVPVWPLAEAEKYLRERVRLHREADLALDADLPRCTDEERWMRPAKWAVMAPGRKTALKLHDSKDAAEAHALTSSKLYVDERRGTPIRCANDYCAVGKAGFCSQWEAERAFYAGASDESSIEATA